MQQMPPPLLFLGRARSKNSWPPKSRKQGIEELRAGEDFTNEALPISEKEEEEREEKEKRDY